VSRHEIVALRVRVARLEAEAIILERLAGLPKGGPERERVYRFIAEAAGQFPVAMLCRVAKVSTSAYYAWRARQGDGPAEAIWEEAILANRIFECWRASRGRYGSPRVTHALRRQGAQVSEKRVARLMAQVGIAGRCGRRKFCTTKRDRAATPSPDRLQRDFTATRPDEAWVGDITYLPTAEGHLFVASVLDVFTRELVGWSIATHLRTELCTDALAAAVARRARTTMAGTIFHTDHGCQYTSTEFRRFCNKTNITQSMGSVGDSYDNAMAESLWASLKRELVDNTTFATKDEARRVVFEWIAWYNNERLHSSLGYVPPREFGASWNDKQAA
jgi:transposase InsO family protein